MGGCGGGDPASDELVRIHTRNTLDFRMDSSEGLEHVFRIDATWVVTRDGTATETVTAPAPGRSKTVELSDAELARIKRALADLDLGELDSRFGSDEVGNRTTVVTYNGQTVTLDPRIMGLTPDDAPAVARPLTRLNRLLGVLLETPDGDIAPGQR
jgi:hypothetical protein